MISEKHMKGTASGEEHGPTPPGPLGNNLKQDEELVPCKTTSLVAWLASPFGLVSILLGQ